MTGWIAEVKSAGFATVAGVAGMSPRGKGWNPCPACGAARRGAGDPRPAVGTNAGGGWQCHACNATGDAVDLLAYREGGRRLSDLDGDGRDRVRLAAAKAGLCAERDGEPPRRLPTARSAPASVQIRRVNRDGGPARVDVVEVSAPEVGGDGRASGRPPPWSDSLVAVAEARLWDDPAAEPVRRYLTAGIGGGPGGTDGRLLPEQTIRDFHLGAMEHDGWWWVVLPILDGRTGDAVNVKLRRVPNEAGEAPKPKYTTCAGRPLTLWGARSLTNDLAAPVIVVEGELDVLALWAYGWKGSVVSGTSGAGAFDPTWLDILEPYQEFVLAYDVEEAKKGAVSAGEAGAEGLADKLGRYRCSRARMPRKDASECLLRGVPVEQIRAAIDQAKPYVGMEVHRVGYWADEIERDISDPRKVYGLPTGSGTLDEMIGGWPDGVTILTGPTKAGKALRSDEPVLTPTGWVPIGHLRVGDFVVSVDGMPTRVTGVFPQGLREVAEVEFSGGEVVVCDWDHLWSVSNDSDVCDNRPCKVMTTRDILDSGLWRGSGKYPRLHWRVPVCSPVRHAEADLPVDPYVLGVLLGDGSLTNGVIWSKPDQEVADQVASRIPASCSVNERPGLNCPIFSIVGTHGQNEVLTGMRELSLMGKLSHEKWVPPQYLIGSVQQRLDLLRGLMDTDGYVEHGGTTRSVTKYSSSSKQLADDFCNLVRSLGGSVRRTEKTPAYLYKGERRVGKRHYMVTFVLPPELQSEVFLLPRKRDLLRAVSKPPQRKILEIRPAGAADCVCITVEHPSKLYVTRDYLVTHNSTFLIWALLEQARMGVPVVLTGFENGIKKVQHKLLRMQLGGDFMERTASDRLAAFAELNRLPIHNVNHYGQAKLDDLVSTMRFHKRRNRVKAVLVDHIGFLIDLGRRDMDETRQLQHAMRTLVTVANDEGLAVFIIAHPDKKAESEGRRVRIFDIRGTSSIQQDCALGLSLERDPKAAEPGITVHVDAMRSEFARGTGAEGWMYFDDEALIYADRWDSLPRSSRINPGKA